MVLHLLGKKSWNVYNGTNVERVRRDEAEAEARENAAEQRMQEEDAARRIAILRGEAVPNPSEPAVDHSGSTERVRRSRDADADGSHVRKRRKLRGEDDTDQEIRIAREDAQVGSKAKQTLDKRSANDAPLVDYAGHLQLIPAPDEKTTRKAEKNAEVEAEKAKKRKREEDQVTMRFSNAAGFKNGMEKPWYASNKMSGAVEKTSDEAVLAAVQEKDVWGNVDPMRKARESNRISSNDPFAAMQQAQRQLKQSGKDKERWQEARIVELKELKDTEEKSRMRRKHGRRRNDGDDLEDFSLDAPIEGGRRRRSEDEQRSHHHRRRRSRSRSRERSTRPR